MIVFKILLCIGKLVAHFGLGTATWLGTIMVLAVIGCKVDIDMLAITGAVSYGSWMLIVPAIKYYYDFNNLA
jgi:hypothetical protein